MEHVTLFEKVLIEHVMALRNNCWNVHTNKRQRWVIDGYMTNLYSQKRPGETAKREPSILLLLGEKL